MSWLKWAASAGNAGMIACIDIGPRPLIAISSGRKPEETVASVVAVLFGAAMSDLIVSSVTSMRTFHFVLDVARTWASYPRKLISSMPQHPRTRLNAPGIVGPHFRGDDGCSYARSGRVAASSQPRVA